jgi:hypothetical protein
LNRVLQSLLLHECCLPVETLALDGEALTVCIDGCLLRCLLAANDRSVESVTRAHRRGRGSRPHATRSIPSTLCGTRNDTGWALDCSLLTVVQKCGGNLSSTGIGVAGYVQVLEGGDGVIKISTQWGK